MNVKRCEASIVDWITGKGPKGPGFHLYCFYENDNEIELARPIYYSGYRYKKVYFEECLHDFFQPLDEIVEEDDPPYYNPKYNSESIF